MMSCRKVAADTNGGRSKQWIISSALFTTISSTREAIGGTVQQILRLAEEFGCCKNEMTDLEIALGEALANAIIHGNENDPRKRVFLRCYCADNGILFTVRDEGKGFDPERVPDPTGAERIHLAHGRGIFLMRELMDHVEYLDGGCEVRLYKDCPGQRPHPAHPLQQRRDLDSVRLR